MNTKRIFLVAPAGLLLVSMFLPFLTLGFMGSANALDIMGDSPMLILPFIASIAMIVMSLLPKPAAKPAGIFLLVFLISAAVAVAALLISLFELLGQGSEALQLVGAGFWLALLSSIAGLVLSILMQLKRL